MPFGLGACKWLQLALPPHRVPAATRPLTPAAPPLPTPQGFNAIDNGDGVAAGSMDVTVEWC